MTWPNKRSIVILFMGFISMVISLKTAKAAETTALETKGANKIEYKSEDLRDPFQGEKIEIKQQVTPAKPLPFLQIQGIVWGGSFPQAIINNKVVKIGDKIEEVQIIDIAKNGVIVLFDNQKYNLSSPAGADLGSLKETPEGGKYEK